jgi:hypothetical protein
LAMDVLAQWQASPYPSLHVQLNMSKYLPFLIL